MDHLVVVMVLAFGAGLLMRAMGYPPMLGYLAAGFFANGMGIGSGDDFAPIADLGVSILLFTIGLKLKISTLTPRYVWGSALLHMVVAVPLTTAVILLAGTLYEPLRLAQDSSAWALAFALSFSSTVLAVKMCEARGETSSFHASIAVGVLVVQDILAVAYLSVASGHYPSQEALLLLLLLFAVPLLKRFLQLIGHGELLLFAGVVFALGTAELFELVHIKGGLGSLLIGMLVAYADAPKAKELYERLASLRNLLLIGFFLQIGYYGIPSLMMVLVASVLASLIVLRPIIYFSIMTLFGLRARTSLLAGMLLVNYSEFGLIVAAASVNAGILSPRWVTTLALAMSLSFFMATPVNKQVHSFYRRYRSYLLSFEKPKRLPEEEISMLGAVNTAVLGMGRVGQNAYSTFVESGRVHIVGIEENYQRAQILRGDGFNCVHGDASDRDFWERTALIGCDLILIGLRSHRENIGIVKLAKELGYTGTLAVAARFADHKEELEAMGCIAFNLYEEAGTDLALHTLEELTRKEMLDESASSPS